MRNSILTLILSVTFVTTACGVQDSPNNVGSVAQTTCADAYAVTKTLESKNVNNGIEEVAYGDASLYMKGNLGCVIPDQPETAAEFMAEFAPKMGAVGGETFATNNVRWDSLNQMHIRVGQSIDGVPVVGAETIVHADATTGRVFSVNGTFIPADHIATAPGMTGEAAMKSALAQAGITPTGVEGDIALTYVLDENRNPQLAWAQLTHYDGADGAELDLVFADAVNGSFVTRHPQHHRAKVRNIYTANNGTSLPGTLLINEGGSSGDSDAQAAYNHIGTTYDYFISRFGRDSFNNAGATMVMSVHVGSNYNNAYWNGQQMAFGDGDGTQFSSFSQSLDVVGHEFSHAVTNYSANLVYMNESGALNEAMSDIFGAGIERFANGNVINTNTWLIGEDCYTPGTAGDALRYMDNPTTDGISYDFYPERYTGDLDNGGVHLNSGIANLAFQLMVEGGQHPRAKTSVNVAPIGFAKAEQIFYRALTVYMTSQTRFEEARGATIQAAADLYGASEVQTVRDAWVAVGVSNAVADFTFDVNYGYAPLEVEFTDLSLGASDWSWDFGDGNTSIAPSPIHIFQTPGYYAIELTVDGNSTRTKYIQVIEKPFVDFGALSQSGRRPVTVEFENFSNGQIYSYEWDFGDSVISTDANPTHEYLYVGDYTVTLTAEGDAGPVKVVKQNFITVNDKKEDGGLGAFFGCTIGQPAGNTPAGGALLLVLAGGAALIVRKKRVSL